MGSLGFMRAPTRGQPWRRGRRYSSGLPKSPAGTGWSRGTVVDARIETFANTTGTGEHKELVLNVQLLGGAPVRPLTIEQIAPHRDSSAATPQANVARLLYKHALNKITSVQSDVADFVRSHF